MIRIRLAILRWLTKGIVFNPMYINEPKQKKKMNSAQRRIQYMKEYYNRPEVKAKRKKYYQKRYQQYKKAITTEIPTMNGFETRKTNKKGEIID